LLRRMAQTVRHLPAFERQRWLWDLVRPSYHAALNLGGKGTQIHLGGEVTVRIPPEFAGGLWEKYEPESIRAVVDWVRANPDGTFLDIGCSMGIFSVAALFASPSVNVIGIDADLPSVAATLRLCRHATANRLRVICGCVGDMMQEPANLEQACNRTLSLLAERRPTGDVGTTRYVTLGSEEAQSVPMYTLDELFEVEISRAS
jgi:SAM-dependent methyltransferase